MKWALALAVVLGAFATATVLAQRAGTSTTTVVTSTSVAPTTTTTRAVPRERAQAGWTVATSSARGVMVDYRTIVIGGVTFRAVRLRARTTLLRWHVGSTDPNLAVRAPADAGPSIDWANEGRAGVVAVFNGGFKQLARAGGAVVDGVTLEPLVPSHMTIALDAAGHWALGLWGVKGYPPRGFHPISYRQNLGPLVWHGALTAAATSPDWGLWGAPLGGVPDEPRSGLGVDARGNLIYVATMDHILVAPLGQALIAAGAVTAMQLDINPYWPILGASLVPLHATGGALPVQLPNSEHSPTVYETGWTRDFFVALAEPNSWRCYWSSPGLHRSTGVAQPQLLRLRGRDC